MSAAYEELDYGPTPLGELILRRRQVVSLDRTTVYEVKLDGAFLMSSLVCAAEIALATESLPRVDADARDVLVGGLGLGYTAKAALDAPGTRSVVVVEYLDRVIDWHRRGLLPLSGALTEDPRCRLVQADFFAMMGTPGLGGSATGGADALPDDALFHAILLDIDHSPQCLLHEAHGLFYTEAGLSRLARRLHPGGVFSIWSADLPEPTFMAALESVFTHVDVVASKFHNVLLSEDDVNYIFVAKK